MDPDEFVRAHGIEAWWDWTDRAQHAYSYRAGRIAEKHRPDDGDWTDLTSDAAIDEAMDFAGWEPPERADELIRHFWPAIACLVPHASSESLEARMKRAQERRATAAEVKACDAILRDVRRQLDAGDPVKAKEVLRDQVGRLLDDERSRNADPVRDLADELDDHAAFLERYRGREFIGLQQRTLPTLDVWTLGLRGLMLLAAAPNVGKTALAVQLGTDIVTHSDDACFLFVSLEMPRMDMMTRIKSRLACMDWKTLVLGSDSFRRPGEVPTYTADELNRLKVADERLRVLGKRIRVLDRANFPAPTVEKILQQLDQLKKVSGAQRAFALLDYLQVLPVPDEVGPKVRTDLEADKWRIGQMMELRDATDGDAVMVISEARKPSGNAGEAWGGAMADVMGSARNAYTPDMLLLFRGYTDSELAQVFGKKPQKASPEDKRAELKRWAKAQREQLGKSGQALCLLDIAKGRDGVHRGTLPLLFRFWQSTFSEDVDRAIQQAGMASAPEDGRTPFDDEEEI
jgi:hypothetical protein